MGRTSTPVIVAAFAIVLGIIVVPLCVRWRSFSDADSIPRILEVSDKAALDAITLMKDWGVWLTGIDTAAIAALGAILKDRRRVTRAPAVVSIVFLALSIVMDTWLLAGLPSMTERLVTGFDVRNDIYEMRVFGFLPFRVGTVYMLSHWYFIFGIVAFAVAFAVAIGHEPDAAAVSTTRTEDAPAR